jgi:protein transport protein SEC24
MAREAARRWQAVVALKGRQTHIAAPDGRLRAREAKGLLGSEREHTLLAPDASDDGQGAFYKTKAVDFSRQHISVDAFLPCPAAGGYLDVATVAALSRYTAGQTYFYPGYTAAADGARLARDLAKDLCRTTGFEAVMRIRCSKGVAITNFYGNFFIRGADLLALPNVTPSTAFNVELAHEEELAPGSTITVQAALLYTATNGERRIAVPLKRIEELIDEGVLEPDALLIHGDYEHYRYDGGDD